MRRGEWVIHLERAFVFFARRTRFVTGWAMAKLGMDDMVEWHQHACSVDWVVYGLFVDHTMTHDSVLLPNNTSNQYKLLLQLWPCTWNREGKSTE